MSDRETVVLVQVDQPFCSREYGDFFQSPTPAAGCQAALSSSTPRKCYNGRFTCQDPDNYNPGTLTLTFSRDQLEITRYYGHAIPSLDEIETTAGSINLSGMDRNAAALGQREVVTLTFKDHQHSDLLVDKYRLQRETGEAAFGSPSVTFVPLEQGTFWGKWLARNPYNQGYALRVYEGYLGDDIEDMRVRHYVIDAIEGPTDGMVKITAKDAFTKIALKAALAPPASRGALVSHMEGSGSPSTSAFTVTPLGIGSTDYGSSASLYVAVEDELIQVTRSADTFTVAQRGCFNTEVKAHPRDSLVQLALVYDTETAPDLIYDLLVTYGAIDADLIYTDVWDAIAEIVDDLYSAVIAQPTPVQTLVGELCEQAGLTVFSEISSGAVEMVALRAGAVTPVVTDDAYIVAESLSVRRQSDRRASQVWVHYGQIDPLGSLSDKQNYRSRYVHKDTDAEDSTQFGTPAIREVFSRWIPQFGGSIARRTAARILAMFRDPPVEAAFTIHASREGEISLARYFYLETSDVQDETGAADRVPLAAVEIERGENQIAVRGQQVTFSDEIDDDGLASRVIYISADVNDLNLRTAHDSVYDAPVGGSPGEVITFVVAADVTVGSSSVSTPGMRTGSWPSGVTLLLQNNGRIQGRGGEGGDGGTNGGPSINGSVGDVGGTAFLAEYAISIDNTNGQIWGGGGGGGGGGAVFEFDPFGSHSAGDGGCGGGGAGTLGGVGGTGILGSLPGQAGTADAGGAGGAGVKFNPPFPLCQSGRGGTGGATGVVGDTGQNASGGDTNGTGAGGGAAGKYAEGNSLITWTATGDRRGNVS